MATVKKVHHGVKLTLLKFLSEEMEASEMTEMYHKAKKTSHMALLKAKKGDGEAMELKDDVAMMDEYYKLCMRAKEAKANIHKYRSFTADELIAMLEKGNITEADLLPPDENGG